jgi:hypothetical protein
MKLLIRWRKYTKAQVALAVKHEELGSWRAVAWDIKKTTGLEITEHTVLAWFRRHRTPRGRIERQKATPKKAPVLLPTIRHRISIYLGIDEAAWWEWHPRSRGEQKPTPAASPSISDEDPWDTSSLTPD